MLQCLEPESVIGSGRSGKRTSKGGHARVENERRKVSRSGDYRDGRSLVCRDNSWYSYTQFKLKV